MSLGDGDFCDFGCIEGSAGRSRRLWEEDCEAVPVVAFRSVKATREECDADQ